MWDIKYRPLTFADVLGQEGSVQVLKSRLKNGTALDTSYVFSGGHGQGKTTLARLLARAMLCENLSLDDPEPCNQCDNCQAILNETSGAFSEMDAASRGTIDNMRTIVDELPFSVFGAPKRIYLFDEAHRMSRDAQDVLLKPLEDKKMVGIFCTTEPEKIRGPIRSRCEHYTIRKVTREDILARMKRVLEAESVAYEDDAILTVIDYAGGHVRDVLNRLEMVAQIGPVTMENVRAYLRLSVVSTYYETLLALDEPEKAISCVEKACEHVLPEEAAAGLAEAAMNSYRLANNMHADFVYMDRDLGRKVYERFGLNTIKLAEYFLRSRYVTPVSLVCDVLSWAQAAGQLTSVPVYIPQPGVTMLPPPPAPVGPAPVAPPPAPPTKPNGGSLAPPPPDSENLTEYDHLVRRPDAPGPRMRDTAQPQRDLNLTSVPTEEDEHRELTPEEWSRLFDRTWAVGTT